MRQAGWPTRWNITVQPCQGFDQPTLRNQMGDLTRCPIPFSQVPQFILVPARETHQTMWFTNRIELLFCNQGNDQTHQHYQIYLKVTFAILPLPALPGDLQTEVLLISLFTKMISLPQVNGFRSSSIFYQSLPKWQLILGAASHPDSLLSPLLGCLRAGFPAITFLNWLTPC